MDTVIENSEIHLGKANPDEFTSIIRASEAAIASILAAHSPSGDMSSEKINGQDSYIPKTGDKAYVKCLGGKLATVVEVAAKEGTAMVQSGKIKIRVRTRNIQPTQSDIKQTPKTPVANLKLQEKDL